MTNRHIHRMANCITTSYILTYLGSELEVPQNCVQVVLTNYSKSIVEAAFHFLCQWKGNEPSDNDAWNKVLRAFITVLPADQVVELFDNLISLPSPQIAQSTAVSNFE